MASLKHVHKMSVCPGRVAEDSLVRKENMQCHRVSTAFAQTLSYANLYFILDP